MSAEDAEMYANSMNALTNQARGVVRDLSPHVRATTPSLLLEVCFADSALLCIAVG